MLVRSSKDQLADEAADGGGRIRGTRRTNEGNRTKHRWRIWVDVLGEEEGPWSFPLQKGNIKDCMHFGRSLFHQG